MDSRLAGLFSALQPHRLLPRARRTPRNHHPAVTTNSGKTQGNERGKQHSGDAPGYPADDAKRALNECHDLGVLYGHATAALNTLQLSQFPPEFPDAIELIGSIERGNPSRSRYESVWNKEKRRMESSFPFSLVDGAKRRRQKVPIGRLANLVETIVKKHLHIAPQQPEQPSFGAGIGEDLDHSHQNIQSELHHLEVATRNGDVVWSEQSRLAPGLRNHKELRELPRLVLPDWHLITDYRGRRLFLIPLEAPLAHQTADAEDADPDLTLEEEPTSEKGAEGQEANTRLFFVLGAGQNNHLSRLVWDVGVQSNLIRTVVRILRGEPVDS